MNKRVVITGLGVVAPNAANIGNFTIAIKKGESGIRFQQELEDLNFSCCIGGIPPVTDELVQQYLTPLQLKNFNSSGILYGCIAGIDAWKDAGLPISGSLSPDWDSGTVFGTGISGVEKFRESIYRIDDKKVKKTGQHCRFTNYGQCGFGLFKRHTWFGKPGYQQFIGLLHGYRIYIDGIRKN